MNSNRQIKMGVIMSYLSIGISIMTGLIYTPWMILSIGKENYGLYTLAYSIIAFFMFDFGLSGAITRFVSKYLAEGRNEKANECLGLVYRLYFYIDILFFVILSVVYFFIPTIYRELTPDEIEKFKVVYAMAAIYSVLSFPFIPVNGILTATEQFVALKLCEVGQKFLIVVTMSVCLLLGYGLYALVLVNALAGIVTILAKLWVIKRYTSINVDWKYDNKNEFREIISFSGWTTIVAFAQRFVFSIVPTLLGMFSGSGAIAVFGIANILEGYVYTFSNAIGGMFLPKVSRVYAQGSDDILPLMTRVGRIQYMVVAAVIIGFICLGGDFIQLWVGKNFSESFICTILIIIPSFLSTPQQIANEAVLAKNKVKKQAVIYFWTSIFNITSACLFIYWWGAIGACISICATYIVRWMLSNIVLYYKELNIDVHQFYKDSLWKLFPAFSFSVITGIALNLFIPNTNIYVFILKVVAFTTIYLISIFLSMNQYERDLLKPFLKYIKK